MHGTPFFRITILFAVCSVFLCPGTFGQKKVDVEVDVAKCWSYSLSESSGERITADESRVFVGLEGARIEALSRDGKKIWSSEFGGEISSNIIATKDNLFLVTSAVSDENTSSNLRWVSKDTGVTNWTVTLPDSDRHYLGLFNGEVVVVSNNGVINSINAKNGSINWARQIAERFVGEPSFAASSVTLATTAKQIFNIALKSGEVYSMQRFPYALTALVATETGHLIVGDERGNISALNGVDKPIWTFKTGGEISKILNFDENILAASHDNFIYSLASRNGGRVWKKRLVGRVGQIARVSEDHVLISSFEESSALLFDLTNGRATGRTVFGENESLAAPPVTAKEQIFLLTNSAVYSYSLNGCPKEK